MLNVEREKKSSPYPRTTNPRDKKITDWNCVLRSVLAIGDVGVESAVDVVTDQGEV